MSVEPSSAFASRLAPRADFAGTEESAHHVQFYQDEEQCGARVDAVSSVGEALGALEHMRPDVLVSDIGLADESGYDLIRTVRARAGLADLPAVALTAYAWTEDRERALSAGYHVHLGKPVDPDALTEVVARLAGRTPTASP